MRMEWDTFKIVLAVARTGTLQGASRELGVDRTTVARQLLVLERRLGALFHRGRTGLTLTAFGESIFDRARRMELEARAILSEGGEGGKIRGKVRIAVTEAMAPFLVLEGLLSICDDHPALHLELLGGNRRLDLQNGEADLALRLDPLKGSRLRARCLLKAPVSLFASREYLNRMERLHAPSALAGHRVLLPAGDLAGLPEARWLASQLGVVPVFTSDSFPALLAAAVRGLGVVPVSAAWGSREPELVRLFDMPDIPPRSIWLVTSEASNQMATCRLVADRLVELFARVTKRVD